MEIRVCTGTIINSIMNHEPVDISEFSDTALMIIWKDGHESIYLYEDLRQMCPCATCRRLRAKSRTGKLPFKKKIPMGGGTTDIKPVEIENVGHYALKFHWNDKHDTGIYTYDFLREKCTCDKCEKK